MEGISVQHEERKMPKKVLNMELKRKSSRKRL
jgi:hypothetical protein